MTWQMVTRYRWVCDGCGSEHIRIDNYQPADWIHTQDGRDLCGRCKPW